MIRYRVRIPPELRGLVTHIPPTIKRKLHASLRLLETDPLVGKPLERELAGYRSCRIHPYRIVYKIDTSRRVVHIVLIAPRRDIYTLLGERLPLTE